MLPTLQASETGRAFAEPIASPSARVEPFPVGGLPTPLARLVTEGAAALPCPPNFLGVLLLPLLGAAIGTSRVLAVTPGWRAGPRLYAAIVAEPGSTKRPALDRVTMPYRRRQRARHPAYLNDRVRYQQALARDDGELADWTHRRGHRRAAGGERPQAPHEPLLPHVCTTDATLDALAALLEQHPRGVACLQEARPGWGLALDPYKGGTGADRHGWLSCWNGAPILVNRKTRQEPIGLDNPCVSVAGGLPPDRLGHLTDARGRADGFAHRLLWAFPAPLAMRWTDVVGRETTMEGYWRVVEGRWTLPGVSAQDPRGVPFTTPGRQTFIAWAHARAAERADPDDPETMRGALATRAGDGARFALRWHLGRGGGGAAHGAHVDAGSVLAASALVDYCTSQARRVYSRLQARPEDERVARVVRWIQIMGAHARCGTCGAAMSGGGKRRQAAETLRQELGDRGLRQLRDTPVPGGRIHTRCAPGDPSRGWPVRSGSAPDSDQQAALGMADRCRVSGRSSPHPRHPTSTLLVGTGRGLAQTSRRGHHAYIAGGSGAGTMRASSHAGHPPRWGPANRCPDHWARTPQSTDLGETDDGSRLRYTGEFLTCAAPQSQRGRHASGRQHR